MLASAIVIALALLGLILDPGAGHAQAPGPYQPPAGLAPSGDAANSSLLQVPVSRLSPGNIQLRPDIQNPVADDPQAINRGQNYFSQFNCVGCHAPNGAGGMGPALSNHKFIYGSSPASIYLSILQGRPKGMPAWNSALPEAVIWDLVSYIQSISKDPQDEWQNTISANSFDTEQVPAESLKTSDPWSYLESFSHGRAPHQHGTPAFPGLNPQ